MAYSVGFALYIFILVHIVSNDGSIVAEKPNSAISDAPLLKILQLKSNGPSMDDIIELLRKQTVPTGCPIHPWSPGITTCNST